MASQDPPRHPLFRLHRILITVAVLQGLILTLWGVHGYFQEGGVGYLAVAILSSVGAGGLYAYLGWFKRKSAPPPR